MLCSEKRNPIKNDDTYKEYLAEEFKQFEKKMEQTIEKRIEKKIEIRENIINKKIDELKIVLWLDV